MREFTYRSARSGSLVAGLGLAIVVETAALHLWLGATHPLLAWCATLSSVSGLTWLASDYRALGRGTIRVDVDGVDVQVGKRLTMRVPLHTIATAMQPSWQDVPAAGEPESANYQNLMNPATPNVLLILNETTTVRFFSAISRPVRRIGLHMDDPAGFIAAIDDSRR